MPAKLNFFSFIASIFEPYLKGFRTDAPVVPFMYDEPMVPFKLMNHGYIHV